MALLSEDLIMLGTDVFQHVRSVLLSERPIVIRCSMWVTCC